MQLTYFLAAGLIPGAVIASTQSFAERRDAECPGLSTSPDADDTCETFAKKWRITVDRLKELNPDTKCPNLATEDTMYCVRTGPDDPNLIPQSLSRARPSATATISTASTPATAASTSVITVSTSATASPSAGTSAASGSSTESAATSAGSSTGTPQPTASNTTNDASSPNSHLFGTTLAFCVMSSLYALL